MFRIPGGNFDLDGILDIIKNLEKKRDAPDFWNDTVQAEKVMSEINRHTVWYDAWNTLKTNIAENALMLELLQEDAKGTDIDESELQTIEQQFLSLEEEYRALNIKAMLSDPHDYNDAFLTIHTGAGGTESCDWVKMLFRLYMRWCEDMSYNTTILDLQEAEGGIKSVSVQVRGAFAFGYLSAETGVHRLVRISPFDSNKRRHTTFASVYAIPLIDDNIEIEIKPEDIRVDTYRAQGAGGQHVNTTDSAVRITHLETGVVVQCQNERSQMKNRQTGLKVLKSRLYKYYEEKKKEEQMKTSATKTDISWGNQIRSYVFHPYNLVKDHRTNVETGNTQAVMNGAITMFIEAYLKKKASPNSGPNSSQNNSQNRGKNNGEHNETSE